MQTGGFNIYLPPGMCDVTDCGNAARYAMGTCYFCVDCLIAAGEKGHIPEGASLIRLPEVAQPHVEEYTS